MGAIASQITSLTIDYSTIYSDADQRKYQSSSSLAFVTGEFPAQMVSNTENISIWWRHHDLRVNMYSLAMPLLPPLPLYDTFKSYYVSLWNIYATAVDILQKVTHSILWCRFVFTFYLFHEHLVRG